MKYKAYKIQPENMAALAPMTVEFYLEFDEDFVFGYTPVTLAAVCRQSQTMARQLAEKLAAMSAAVVVRNDSEWSRPGLHVLLDDRDWLAKMTKVAAAYAADEPVAIGATGTTVALLAPIVQLTTVSPPTIAKVRDVLAAHTEGLRPEPSKSLMVTGDETAASQPASEQKKEVPLYLPSPNIGQFLLPNMFARSRLFHAGGARNSTRQVWSTDKPLVIQRLSGMRGGETRLTYSGGELRMGDQELWTMLLNVAAGSALGEDVTERFVTVLKSMPGRGVGGNGRDRMRSEGNRLAGGNLKIRTTDQHVIQLMKQSLPKNKSIQGTEKNHFVELTFPMLESFSSNTESITFRISRELRVLFGPQVSSWYDLEKYYALPQAGLSRRLYILYNSHYDCWPLKLTEFQEYLGVLAKTARNIKLELDAAHAELKLRDIIVCWEYRKPTDEERKHCDALCYVVQRPNRELKTIELAAEEVPA
jgi:hypothetical protein